jgi:hypothetical protein
MRTLERLIEVLETINPFIARERAVIFNYARRALKREAVPTVWQVEELMKIAETDPSEHFRGLARDCLAWMKALDL